ncbi:MAG: protoporphyrinogen oxidase HemJ [Hyphomicrobiaceae bacterium]|nr:protoporphyrinogen oxidase HemJ [Hyphomicrobiaceae bacterium]
MSGERTPSSASAVRSRILRAGIGLALPVVIFGALVLIAPGPQAYLWWKALHVMAVIAWMAGLFYLPRLFVYHVSAEAGSVQSETFKVMERRLMRAIINPAMIVTWGVGLWLAYDGFGFLGGWLHAKIALVVLMSAFHGYLSAGLRAFAEDRNEKSEKHWRIANEVPTLLMIAIVILVIVKPF